MLRLRSRFSKLIGPQSYGNAANPQPSSGRLIAGSPLAPGLAEPTETKTRAAGSAAQPQALTASQRPLFDRLRSHPNEIIILSAINRYTMKYRPETPIHVPPIVHDCVHWMCNNSPLGLAHLFSGEANKQQLKRFIKRYTRVEAGNLFTLSPMQFPTAWHLFRTYIESLPDPIINFGRFFDSVIQVGYTQAVSNLHQESRSMFRAITTLMVHLHAYASGPGQERLLVTHFCHLVFRRSVLAQPVATTLTPQSMWQRPHARRSFRSSDQGGGAVVVERDPVTPNMLVCAYYILDNAADVLVAAAEPRVPTLLEGEQILSRLYRVLVAEREPANLWVTTYRTLIEGPPSPGAVPLSIPHLLVASAEVAESTHPSSPRRRGKSVLLALKTHHRYAIGVESTTLAVAYVEMVLALSRPTSPLTLFAFAYRPPGLESAAASWCAFRLRDEFRRLGLVTPAPSPGLLTWTLTTLNANHDLIPAYDAAFPVLASCSEADVKRFAQARLGNRLVVPLWATAAAAQGLLLQAGELDLGALGEPHDVRSLLRQPTDTPYLLAIAAAHARLTIVNPAPRSTTWLPYANTSIRYRHLSLPRNAEVAAAIATMVATWSPDPDEAAAAFHASGLRRVLQLVLHYAAEIAGLLQRRQAVLLVRPATHGVAHVLGSLVQVLLDPHYRSAKGLGDLCEKDWCRLGGPDFGALHFSAPAGAGGGPPAASATAPAPESADPDQHSDAAQAPAGALFELWLIALHQLLVLFPAHFEYTEALLLHVIDEIYACRVGNFLASSSAERGFLQARTYNLWALPPPEAAAQRNPAFWAVAAPPIEITPYVLSTLRVWDRRFGGDRATARAIAAPPPWVLGAEARALMLRPLPTIGAIPVAMYAFARLRLLDLGHCALFGLSPAAFAAIAAAMPRLRALNLAGTRLAGVCGLEYLASLRALNLRDNRLPGVPEQLARLTRLRELDLSGNIFAPDRRRLHEGRPLRALAALATLDLSGTTFDDGAALAALAALTALNLSGTAPTAIAACRGGLPSLRALHLHDNMLRRLPDWAIAGVPDLRELRLDGNIFVAVPRELGALPGLVALSLRRNVLCSFAPPAPAAFAALATLDLSHNQLTSVPPGLLAIRGLRHLNLGYNRIERLPTTLAGALPRLVTLDLSHNHIRTLDNATGLRHLRYLRVLRLQHNPYRQAIPALRVLRESFGTRIFQDADVQDEIRETTPCTHATLIAIAVSTAAKDAFLAALRRHRSLLRHAVSSAATAEPAEEATTARGEADAVAAAAAAAPEFSSAPSAESTELGNARVEGPVVLPQLDLYRWALGEGIGGSVGAGFPSFAGPPPPPPPPPASTKVDTTAVATAAASSNETSATQPPPPRSPPPPPNDTLASPTVAPAPTSQDALEPPSPVVILVLICGASAPEALTLCHATAGIPSFEHTATAVISHVRDSATDLLVAAETFARLGGPPPIVLILGGTPDQQREALAAATTTLRRIATATVFGAGSPSHRRITRAAVERLEHALLRVVGTTVVPPPHVAAARFVLAEAAVHVAALVPLEALATCCADLGVPGAEHDVIRYLRAHTTATYFASDPVLAMHLVGNWHAMLRAVQRLAAAVVTFVAPERPTFRLRDAIRLIALRLDAATVAFLFRALVELGLVFLAPPSADVAAVGAIAPNASLLWPAVLASTPLDALARTQDRLPAVAPPPPPATEPARGGPPTPLPYTRSFSPAVSQTLTAFWPTYGAPYEFARVFKLRGCSHAALACALARATGLTARLLAWRTAFIAEAGVPGAPEYVAVVQAERSSLVVRVRFARVGRLSAAILQLLHDFVGVTDGRNEVHVVVPDDGAAGEPRGLLLEEALGAILVGDARLAPDLAPRCIVGHGIRHFATTDALADTFGATLGAGSRTLVRQTTVAGTIVAVKMFVGAPDLAAVRTILEMRQEAHMLAIAPPHGAVMRLIGIVHHPFALVLEYQGGGSLFAWCHGDGHNVIPAQEVSADLAPSQEIPSQDTPSQETPSQDTPSQEIPSQDTPSQETPSQNPPTNLAPSRKTPTDLAPAQNPPTDLAPSRKTPTNLAPSQKTPMNLAPSQNPPTDLAPSRKTPTNLAPSQNPPTNLAPSRKTPTNLAPAQKTPSQETPSQNPPTNLAPSRKIPTNLAPSQNPPTNLAPAQNPPTNLAPSQNPPTNLAPSQNPPTNLDPSQNPPNHDATHIPQTWPAALRIAHDLAAALAHLHSLTPPMLHRDIKSPNVLLAGPTPDPEDWARLPAVLKLGDFGLATLAPLVTGRHVDNPIWLAPEVMATGADYGTAADVYSYGVVLYEILARRQYFAGFHFMSDLEAAVLQGRRPELVVAPRAGGTGLEDRLANDCAQIVRDCWQQDPRARPRLVDVLPRIREMLRVVDTIAAARAEALESASRGGEIALHLLPSFAFEDTKEDVSQTDISV